MIRLSIANAKRLGLKIIYDKYGKKSVSKKNANLNTTKGGENDIDKVKNCIKLKQKGKNVFYFTQNDIKTS